LALEQESGFVLAGSPTQYVGYAVVSDLKKERHDESMLSLQKTKSSAEIAAWLGDKQGLLSWKLDGVTLVLTYNDGKLAKALTRGNGEVGEVVTHNACVFSGLPRSIPFAGALILRGEAVISYADFEAINAELGDTEEKYKNPRNLVGGSVRQLSSEIAAKRRVAFHAFSLVRAQGVEFGRRIQQLEFLQKLGFSVVEHTLVNTDDVETVIEEYGGRVAAFPLPVDGLVICHDDIAYGEGLGRTAKFPRDAIAFKWADELAWTKLVAIEWSPSRTGRINPVAIFEPVWLEGTTVSRASLHNISIIRGLRLGIGDDISVYKANMIIPQIAENRTGSDTVAVPGACPACGHGTEIRAQNDAEFLHCPNPDCAVKQLKSFALLVSRDGLNVDGLSEATLEKLLARGFIRTYADLFHLERFRDEIIKLEGFGEKSYENLQQGINNARHTTLPRLLYGLGIEGIGTAGGRLISREFDFNLDRIRSATAEELAGIDGIGPVIAGAVAAYFADEKKAARLDALLKELSIARPEAQMAAQDLAGLSFVVTGTLTHFANRNALKEAIEGRGGKLTGSVSKKTTALINNDSESNSGKNKNARSLGIPVLTEEEFMERYIPTAQVT